MIRNTPRAEVRIARLPPDIDSILEAEALVRGDEIATIRKEDGIDYFVDNSIKYK